MTHSYDCDRVLGHSASLFFLIQSDKFNAEQMILEMSSLGPLGLKGENQELELYPEAN